MSRKKNLDLYILVPVCEQRNGGHQKFWWCYCCLCISHRVEKSRVIYKCYDNDSKYECLRNCLKMESVQKVISK